MSEMKINRFFGKPVKTDYTAKKAEKKADTAHINESGQQTEKTAYEKPFEKRIDTLLLSEEARASASAKSMGQILGGAPRRSPGETDEHWMKRLISYETASAWRLNSRQWSEESKDMGVVAGIRYQGEKATEWVTDLMENEPAMFREWLGREKWHMEEGDLENAILPKGFTAEDFDRWMEKDVIDYL